MDAMLNGSFGQVSLHTTGLTIGRAPDNQLVIGDVKASSRHAQLNFNGQGYNLIDIGSTNGTFVNEQRLERNVPRVLSNGDVIRIGETAFSYVITGAQKIAPTVNANAFQNDEQYNPTLPAPQPAQPAPQPAPVYQPAQPAPQGYIPGPSPYNAPAGSAYPQQAQQPPYPYPQQPFQQQPSYPQQPYPPAYRMPPRRNLTWLWITLGGVGALVIGVIILLIVLGAIAISNAPSASKTLDTFCTALLSGDYHTAYSELSPGMQSQLSEPVFLASLASAKVTGCTHDTPIVNGSTATANLTLASASQSTNNGIAKITLAEDANNNWKISNLQNPNNGSSTFGPSPSQTLGVFCRSMLGGDYNTAYGTLSSAVQSQLTEQEFAAALLGSKVTTCTYDTPVTNGTRATSNLTLDFNPANNNGTGTATLLQEGNGNWKISALQSPGGSGAGSSTPTPVASSV